MKANLLLLVTAALLAFSTAGQAQIYPKRQVTIIVPVAAGGLTDIIARMAADYIEKKTGQTVIVDNRTGAGGMIGLGAMARAQPDGYTLAMAINGDIVINPFLHKQMPYEPARDFEPVSLIAEAPQMLVTSSTIPVSSLAEFVTYAKARPGQVAYGSTGVGSSSHLGAHLFAKLAGLSLTHVPYRGAAPAVNDLIAGHIQAMHVSLGPVAGQLSAGTLKALVVAAPKRWSAIPDVPSSAELGLPDYVGSVWFGLFAPHGTPPEIIQTLNQFMKQMTTDPAYKARLKSLHLDAVAGPAETFKKQIEDESPVWKQIVAETSATAD